MSKVCRSNRVSRFSAAFSPNFDKAAAADRRIDFSLHFSSKIAVSGSLISTCKESNWFVLDCTRSSRSFPVATYFYKIINIRTSKLIVQFCHFELLTLLNSSMINRLINNLQILTFFYKKWMFTKNDKLMFRCFKHFKDKTKLKLLNLHDLFIFYYSDWNLTNSFTSESKIALFIHCWILPLLERSLNINSVLMKNLSNVDRKLQK